MIRLMAGAEALRRETDHIGGAARRVVAQVAPCSRRGLCRARTRHDTLSCSGSPDMDVYMYGRYDDCVITN
jgi:hypothetical protein